MRAVLWGVNVNRIKLKLPVIVEGKYDKARLSSVIDAVIISTSGFGVFKNEEKRTLIRTLGKNGIITLCDSDGGGKLIRSHLRGMLGGIPVYDLYTPQIEGKERRKSARSAEGYLGVEGVPSDLLRGIFEKFAIAHPEAVESGEAIADAGEKTPVTRALLYELGLSGGEGASEKRDALCVRLGLPRGMGAKALFEALLMISSAEEVVEEMKKIQKEA